MAAIIRAVRGPGACGREGSAEEVQGLAVRAERVGAFIHLFEQPNGAAANGADANGAEAATRKLWG